MLRSCLAIWMLILFTLVGAQLASAETISHGPWEVVLDAASGDWRSLRWNDDVVAESAPVKMSADVQTAPGQWLGDRRSGDALLARHTWDQASATLVLTRRCGDWELAEEMQFGAAGNPDRLSRKLQVTYRPAGDKKTEPAKFHNVRFRAWLPKSGRSLYPASDPFGSVDLSFRLPDGAVQHRSICELTGSFDWRQVEGTLDVPAGASGLHVRLGLNGATGTMWIDQVELETLDAPKR